MVECWLLGARREGPGGARRALRGATESTVHHIHNFSETHNYKPSCQPQGSDRSLLLSRVKSDRCIDGQTQGSEGDRVGTGGRGHLSEAGVGHTQNSSLRGTHPGPFHRRSHSEIESPWSSCPALFVFLRQEIIRNVLN